VIIDGIFLERVYVVETNVDYRVCHGEVENSFSFFPPSLPKTFLRGGMEGASTEESLLMREIEDHPVVSSLSFIRAIGRYKAGYRANLRCGRKQVGSVRMSSKRPTLQDCLRELGRLIQQDHGPTFVAAAQELQPAEKDAVDASTKRPDASEAPVAMIVNSSELRAAGFDLREVIPLQLEAATRGARRKRGAALKQIHGMGTRRYVLSVDNDNEFRSRCE
jgi:hypothetical protein